ncbi:PREDICTED: nuclear GTPase SLIP-GC-like [Cyprinodon variegatus]|uniref:nuclear GTPase SLIP-GC-like n=1 Tax=Cyprinodon variegatus TaxID=28743 RepID=UPI00074268EA|nr:PREDICTED: nuclear GTPase SLIP-GC-like [Cyprinodon variegatus]
MDTFVHDKLNQWGLNEFIKKFEDEGVDKESLYCLEDKDILILIPKVGPRARFKKKLRMLKEEESKRNGELGPKACQQQEKAAPGLSKVVSSASNIYGKRKSEIELQEKSKEDKPAVKRQRGSFQNSEEMILNDVKNIMAHVHTNLSNQDSTDLNEFLKTKIKDLEMDKRELVGVFGKTGAGKTSLINAVLGVRTLLPSGDVDACTSVMIKVESNMHNSKYEAEIEFITKEEWEDEVGTIDQSFEDDGEQERHDDDDDIDSRYDLFEKLSAVYGEEWKQKSSQQLMDIKNFREIPEFLQSTKKILTCESSKDLSSKIVKYTRQGGKREIQRWYWPLVKCVTVKVPNNDFLQHVTLVDLPGNGDRNKSRDTMWKRIVGNCSAVWIVSEINRAAADKESWEILKSASSLLGNGGECRHIHFICTKSDVLGDVHDNSAADLQALILKRNMKAKLAVNKEFNKITMVKVGIKHLNICKSNAGVNKVVSKHLQRKLNSQLAGIRKEMGMIYATFGKCLDEGVEISKNSCDQILKSILHLARKSGSAQYNIMKNAVKNGGIHLPKKGKEINFNMKLSASLNKSIDEEFRKTFPVEGNCGPFNGVINTFSLDTEKLQEKYKDAELQLIFLKTEEEKLKKKLTKMTRDGKKEVYISLTKKVEEIMQECYREAAQFQGKNTLQNIRETIKRHVNNNKDTMFAKAKDVMMEKLMKLMVDILGVLEKEMMESIELSVEAEDDSIPDVSTALSMVKQRWVQLHSINS